MEYFLVGKRHAEPVRRREDETLQCAAEAEEFILLIFDETVDLR